MKKLAVFCGASIGFNPIYKEAAIKVGSYMGQQKIDLVYGGTKIGLMGALANELIKHKSNITGVIPHLLRNKEILHPDISKVIITDSMSSRKVEMSKIVDGYIALAGGFGTLDEIFEALTLGQLGIENKPIGILNTNDFFIPVLNQLDLMVKEGFLKQENRNMILVDTSIEHLITKMNNYQAPKISNIIDTAIN